jgi:hypothetical protein
MGNMNRHVLALLLILAGCQTWSGGTIDYTALDQPFEFPAHKPENADNTSRHYLIKNGARISISHNYPRLPIADETIIVEVWVYRYDTNGDGHYDLWRKEFDFPEITLTHPDGSRTINPPHRQVLLYIGGRYEENRQLWVFRRVLIDKYSTKRRLGADGIFERQIERPASDLRPGDIETTL